MPNVISKTIEKAVNDQINMELFSAYLYLSMSAYCESANLPGAAKWLRQQAKEEVAHGMKFFDFLNDRGGRVVLGAIEKPAGEFGSLREIFEQSLAHERKVTQSIHKLYTLASGEGDIASLPLLQWFVSEQIEEEKNAGQIVELLKRAGSEGAALLFLDRQLGERTPETD
jgi:ferritin